MFGDLLSKYGIKQLGFRVSDLEQAAKTFAATLGAGPFFDLGVSEPTELLYRGKPSNMRSRCALGQLADMQIELIEVQTDEPDVYQELGRYGLHHFCIWTDDVDQVKADFIAEGYEIAMEMMSGQGLHVIYFDCREVFGCYVEVNAPIEGLAMGVKAQSMNWDGSRPLRSISELMG